MPINARLLLILFMALAAGVGMFTAIRYHTAVRYPAAAYAAIFLATFTGMIHFYLGILGDWLLLANGLGFFALVSARYFPIAALQPYRHPLLWTLFLYTIVTIVGYFVTHAPVAYDTLGLSTKAVELLLLAALVSEWRSQQRASVINGLR